MTNPESDAIVGIDKTGPQVRKGKAMLQIHTQKSRSLNRPYDLKGIMPLTEMVGRFDMACLTKAGPSGYLGPGASICIPG